MPKRRALSTTVVETSWLTPSMVRVILTGRDLEGFGVPGQFDDGFRLQVREFVEREPPQQGRAIGLGHGVAADHR